MTPEVRFLERNDFFVTPAGNSLVSAVKVWTHSGLEVDSAPPASIIDKLLPLGSGRTARGQPGHRLQIVVASQRYLLLGAEYPARMESSPTQTREFFLHDRVRNRWSELPVEGNLSRCRLFDPWLSTIVVMDNPSKRPSPGKENERHITDRNEMPGLDTSSARFPSVQDMYPIDQYRPGILVLQNLEDGRKIRIETGQEDSEILSVRGDAVLYRVNETIYQARIVGDKLRGSSVLVKDDDVPEIHWVFWGPQTEAKAR